MGRQGRSAGTHQDGDTCCSLRQKVDLSARTKFSSATATTDSVFRDGGRVSLDRRQERAQFSRLVQGLSPDLGRFDEAQDRWAGLHRTKLHHSPISTPRWTSSSGVTWKLCWGGEEESEVVSPTEASKASSNVQEFGLDPGRTRARFSDYQARLLETP